MRLTSAYLRSIPKPQGYYVVLQFQNAKTSKGEKLGWLTGIMYLAPANESGVIDVCTSSSEGCRKSCLYTAGRAEFTPSIISARLRKTLRLVSDRELFIACLRYDIARAVLKARRMRLKLAIRVNGTSDLPWLALMMAGEYPTVQFYDYTKHAHAWTRVRANYHLTFSHSENNQAECERALENGLNVATVFHVKRGAPLPTEYLGRPVIDGDLHDLRFLDPHSGVIIGLRAKGKARRDCSGFVVAPPTLVQIQPAIAA